MTYLFDTSSFIAWWHGLYPLATFADIFEFIGKDIESKLIQSPVEVRMELEEKADDSLTEWAKNQPGLFIPIQSDLQADIANIVNKFSKILKKKIRLMLTR